MICYENIQTDKKVELKKPFRYLGGKTRLVKTLLACVPKHEMYLEPFAGGATLFWAKTPAKTSYLNDTNDIVYKAFKVLKYHAKELEEELKSLLPCEKFYRDITEGRQIPRNDIEEVAFWAYTGLWSFRGLRGKSSYIDHLSSVHFKIWELEKYARPLKNAVITKGDYKALLINAKAYKEAFFYLDPPYLETVQDYNCEDVDLAFFEELASLLRQVKGKFLLSHLADERIADIFKDFYCVSVPTVYMLGGNKENGNALKKQEYLISNYDLDPYLNADKLNLFKDELCKY